MEREVAVGLLWLAAGAAALFLPVLFPVAYRYWGMAFLTAVASVATVLISWPFWFVVLIASIYATYARVAAENREHRRRWEHERTLYELRRLNGG